ncbi:MAG TPA: hypothetical protein VKA04_00590, partial [Pseudodesulfovibrio sp.]|nr:hypothetical protein [Pseudodesulfovibrio sp.]
DSETTPSARVLAAMRAQGTGFFTFARRLSEQHREWFLSRPLAREDLEAFEEMAGTSLREQAELEASDDVSFDEFLRRYFAQRLEAQT